MQTRLMRIAMLAIPLVSLVASMQPSFAQRHAATAAASPLVELRMAMRKLWEDHITYTRNYIISALADLPDRDAVAKRLLKNQDDIGNAIKPYYGADAGKELASLLRDHILIATEVVEAAREGDTRELADAQKKWSANGKDIARFFSDANPNWRRTDLERMLQAHLDLTTGEVVSRLKKDWAGDIEAYDEGHDHMLMFADMLVDGLAEQFPSRFERTGESDR